MSEQPPKEKLPAWPKKPERANAGRYGEVQWMYAEYVGNYDYIGRKYELDRANAAIERLRQVGTFLKGRMPCPGGECCDELRQMIASCEVPTDE